MRHNWRKVSQCQKWESELSQRKKKMQNTGKRGKNGEREGMGREGGREREIERLIGTKREK